MDWKSALHSQQHLSAPFQMGLRHQRNCRTLVQQRSKICWMTGTLVPFTWHNSNLHSCIEAVKVTVAHGRKRFVQQALLCLTAHSCFGLPSWQDPENPVCWMIAVLCGSRQI